MNNRNALMWKVLMAGLAISLVFLTAFAQGKTRALVTLIVGGRTLHVELADTAAERTRGLSGRSRVSGDGMLFVIDPPSRQAFWMKDMNFGLDLIWIADQKIVGIEKNVPPPPANTLNQDLQLYRPPTPVSLVLEVPAGRAQEWGIGTSDAVSYTPLKQRE